VPLSPGTARALWPLVARRDADELLFTSETGRLIDQSNLASRVLKPAARRVGIPWASFHTFRHTAASAFFRAGWNAKQVQFVLGHYSPAFTLATYVHLIPDDLPDAAFLDEEWQQGDDLTHRHIPRETQTAAAAEARSTRPPAAVARGR
jgi:integrase